MQRDTNRLEKLFQELTGIPAGTCQLFFETHTIEEVLKNPLLIDTTAARRKKISALAELHTLIPASKLLWERTQIAGPDDACKYFAARMGLLDHEEVHALFLDTRNRVIAYEPLSTGNLAGTTIGPHLLARAALKHNAKGIIIGHNHPSGDTKPSPEDLATTKDLIDGLKILEIEIIDHIIVGGGSRGITFRDGTYPLAAAVFANIKEGGKRQYGDENKGSPRKVAGKR